MRISTASGIFNSSDHQDLVGRKTALFCVKIILWLGLSCLGYALMLGAGSAIAASAGLLLAAAMAAHGVELQHQALHEMGFDSRPLNRVAGFFLGLPLLISFSHYKDRHLHHHAYVGTPEDSEFFGFSKVGNRKPMRLLANLLMIPHGMSLVRNIALSITGKPLPGFYNALNGPRAANEYRLFALVLLLLILAAATTSWLLLLPMLVAVVAAPIHTLVELPEHLGCQAGPDVFQNTRSITSNAFLTWFTNGNNFHVEHHLLPNVVPERLHVLHARVSKAISNLDVGYVQFILDP